MSLKNLFNQFFQASSTVDVATLRRIFDTLDEVTNQSPQYARYKNIKYATSSAQSAPSDQDGTDQVTLEQFKAMASLMERRASEEDS